MECAINYDDYTPPPRLALVVDEAERITDMIAYCKHNTTGKHDGEEFMREARNYTKARGLPISAMAPGDIDAHPGASRFATLKKAIDGLYPSERHDTFAFFCHGQRTWLQVAGGLSNVPSLAESIAARCTPDVRVILYSCMAGLGPDGDLDDGLGAGDEGGWADELRWALFRLGVYPIVYAHATAGHCCRNPYVVRFAGKADMEWVVSPGTPSWLKWRKALTMGDFRFRFPFMSANGIANELAS